MVKRILDLSLVIILFIPFIVVIGVFSLLVFLQDFHNPFYWQKRLGYKGREFNLYKIRSMNIDAEKNGMQLAVKDDERITKIGSFMRKRRIDEMPQIFNILLGQMSFVGPRPERKDLAEKICLSIPNFNDRLAAKPGLTGLAQTREGYSAEASHKLKYDLEYIKRQSFCLDISILWKTIFVVLKGKGAR